MGLHQCLTTFAGPEDVNAGWWRNASELATVAELVACEPNVFAFLADKDDNGYNDLHREENQAECHAIEKARRIPSCRAF